MMVSTPDSKSDACQEMVGGIWMKVPHYDGYLPIDPQIRPSLEMKSHVGCRSRVDSSTANDRLSVSKKGF